MSYSKLIFTLSIWASMDFEHTNFWHFQLLQLFFLNPFYVNINILAKKILFGYECWHPYIYDLILDFIHMNVAENVLLIENYQIFSNKAFNSYNFNKLLRFEISFGIFPESLGLPLMVLQINKKRHKTNIRKIPYFVWILHWYVAANYTTRLMLCMSTASSH